MRLNIKELRGIFMSVADKSDPLNQKVVVGARAYIDGELCGWKGEADMANHASERETIEAAMADLVLQVLRKPKQLVDDPTGVAA